MDQWAVPPAEPQRGFFFVMGAPKSGTTWMQAMLNAHPQVSCFGEGHFVEFIAQPMEVMLRRYNQKLGVVSERVFEGRPPYGVLDYGDVVALQRAAIVALMRRGGPADTLWWGDKTPAYARQIGPLNTLFPQAQFIHVVRDPRDTVVSALYHARRAGMLDDLDDVERRQMLIANSIEIWRDTMFCVAHAAPVLGPRLLQLRYTDLVADTAASLRLAFAHLGGVAVTDAVITAVMAQTSFEAMSGGRRPGEADDGSFFRSGTNGQYRTVLAASEIALIEANLEPLMREYGFLKHPANADRAASGP